MTRKILTPVVVVATLAAMVFLIKFRYGGYGDYYYVRVDMPRAAQNLLNGADVRENGYIIGDVSEIKLAHRRVELTLRIKQDYRVPQDARAFVDLKTLLGEKFVDLRFDRYREPWLGHGDRIKGDVGPELEDALANGVQVFDALRPDDLATVIGNLARGARGHGDDIARNLEANEKLSGIFAKTLKPQVQGLRGFDVIFGELKTRADDLNRLADAINEGVPVYASRSAQRDLDRALRNLVPFADDFADLLIYNRRDWDVMMDRGDRVLQTIVNNRGGLHSLVTGLGTYVYKLGGTPPYIFDGSAMAPFTNFMADQGFEETLREVCTAIPPDVRNQIPACSQQGG